MKSLLKYAFILGLLLLGTIGRLSAMTPNLNDGHCHSHYFKVDQNEKTLEGQNFRDELVFSSWTDEKFDFNILIEEKYEEEDDDEESHILQAKLVFDHPTDKVTFGCLLWDTYFQKTTLPFLQYKVEPIAHKYLLLETFRL